MQMPCEVLLDNAQPSGATDSFGANPPRPKFWLTFVLARPITGTSGLVVVGKLGLWRTWMLGTPRPTDRARGCRDPV